jgi:hypothetical protein
VEKRKSEANVNDIEKQILCRIRNYFHKVANGEIVINPQQVVKDTAMCSGFLETTVKMYTNVSNEEDPAIIEEKFKPRIQIDDF